MTRFNPDRRTGAEAQLKFKINKSLHVTRSVLLFSLRSQLEQAVGYANPLQFIADSSSIFEIIRKRTHESEKIIMLNIHAVREAYKEREISKWVSFAQIKIFMMDKKKQRGRIQCSINFETDREFI